MTMLAERLSAYEDYHRDRRNVATHMVGVPLIVFALSVLLSRPMLPIAPGVIVTPTMVLTAIAAIAYLRLDLAFGIAMTVLLALSAWAGFACAALTTPAWLAIGIGSFVVGWTFQLLGHYFEGRKPAFVDDISGLFVGPLFVTAEAGFMLGIRRDLRAAMRDDAARRGAVPAA